MPKVVTAFKRYEKKYLLTEKQYNNLIKVLETKMKTDHHGKHTFVIFILIQMIIK